MERKELLNGEKVEVTSFSSYTLAISNKVTLFAILVKIPVVILLQITI